MWGSVSYVQFKILTRRYDKLHGRHLTVALSVAGLLWDDRLSCQHCHREMKNEHSLNVHISRYHNQACVPVQAVCPVCSKTYSNQYSLRTHMHLQGWRHFLHLQSKTFFYVFKNFQLFSNSLKNLIYKSFCLQHKDQLFLLGQKKRGRRPGSSNKDFLSSVARQQSHYFNTSENEELHEMRVSHQNVKHSSLLDLRSFKGE